MDFLNCIRLIRTCTLSAIIWIFVSSSPCFAAIPVNGGNEYDIQAVLNSMGQSGGDRVIELSGTFNKLNRQVYIEKNNVQIVGINNPILNNIVFLIDAHNVSFDGLTVRGVGQGEYMVIGNLPPGSSYPFTDLNSSTQCHSNRIQNCAFEDLFSQNGEGGAIIKVLPYQNNYGTQISNNTFTGWGNGSSSTHCIKIGAERLRTNATYANHPVFTSITQIEGNYFEGNQTSPPGTYSSCIQLYNPSHVIDNEIRDCFAGVATKGSDNLVKRNKLDNMYGDGALYMRDGNRNVFEDNLIENSFAGFYAWSGKQAIFRNNVFANNTRCGTINAAKHNGYRPADWDMSLDPLANQGLSFPNQTSHQFTNDQTLFVNNTFYKNDYGIQWDIWTIQTSFAKPDTTYFVNNIFWGDDGNTFRDKLFLKWNPGNPSDQGGIPNDPVAGSVYLYDNIYYNGFDGSVPAVYVGGQSNNGTVNYQPCKTTYPYTPLGDAFTTGLTNSSPIPGFQSAHGVMTFPERRGACLEVCGTVGPTNTTCELLLNGNFDNGLASWLSWGCTPTPTNGEAVISNISPGSIVWESGFYQEGIPIIEGYTYTVTFRGKASANRTIDVKLGLGVPPYTSYAYQVFNLTTTIQDYTFTFEMTSPSDYSTKFDFLIGNNTAAIHLDDMSIEEQDCSPISLKVLLEGCYDSPTNQMNNAMTVIHKILPGQSNSIGQAGQPYHIAPWNYLGTEGATWGDADYKKDWVDWILVSLRTDIAKSSEVLRVAALLRTDGQVVFVEPVELANLDSVYIVIEHRNHLGLMSPIKVPVVNGLLSFDFTTQDGFTGGGLGAVELMSGVWGMFAGDGAQLSDVVSYDINGEDTILWKSRNGDFAIYFSGDFNMDGDVNGNDRLFWVRNNGVYSGVPR